jgi:hypothetical protein
MTDKRYRYNPCEKGPDGKHLFITIDQSPWDLCGHCKQPRYAIREPIQYGKKATNKREVKVSGG